MMRVRKRLYERRNIYSYALTRVLNSVLLVTEQHRSLPRAVIGVECRGTTEESVLA
jgi:hypothetical protein